MKHMMLAMAAVMAASAAAVAEPLELLGNPGFEDVLEPAEAKVLPRNVRGIGVWDDALVRDWTAITGHILSDSDARSGARSLKMVLPGGVPEARVNGRLRVDIKPGGLYRLSVWAKGRGRLTLNVTQYNASNFLCTDFLPAAASLELNDAWQQVKAEYRPTDRRLHQGAMGLVLAGDGAEALLDEASFTFDPAENPGIDLAVVEPGRELALEVTGRDAAIEVMADGQAVPLEKGRATVRIREGLTALAIRAGAAGAHPGVRARLIGCPETDGRWRTTAGEQEGWTAAGFDDGAWPTAAVEPDGMMWSAEPGARTACFRQVLLWNETHYGPNRCIMPPAKEWGFSRGSMDNLLLALYSPLSRDVTDFEFVLEVPAGVRLFGLDDLYYQRYVLNHRPAGIQWEEVRRDGAPYSRYRLRFAKGQVPAAATHYAWLPLRMDAGFSADRTAFFFRRTAAGNFTELEQRLPVAVLPPINGRQPKRIMLSQYYPLPDSPLSPEHLRAVVEQSARIGFNFASLCIIEPGRGQEWNDHHRFYYTLAQKHGIRTMLSLPEHFPLYGSLVRGEPREANTFGRWVESVPEARARYFRDSVSWDISQWLHYGNMYCPTYMLGEGQARAVELMKQMYARLLARTPTAEILWLDYEDSAWKHADGRESYCFCDRCKESFRAFARLPADADLSDESIRRNYHGQWVDFHFWQVAAMQPFIKKAVNALGLKFMLYAPPLLQRLGVNETDLVFQNSPGCGVADSFRQASLDQNARFLRGEKQIPHVMGQRFAFSGQGIGKDGWRSLIVLSDDAFVSAKTWKSEVLRIVAAYGGGIDLQNATECVAGMAYWIGEAMRIIATHEDLFLDGERADTLAASDQIAYPNLLVLKRGGERLVLLFNEDVKPLDVTLRNLELKPGQQAQVFETGGWVDAASLPLTVPAGDAVAVHVRE